MFLTPEQLYEIQKIITEHHQAFMANTIGPQVVPEEVLKVLKAKGLIKEPLDGIGEAYTYGQLLGTLETKAVASMSYAEFKNHTRKHPVPLTEMEREAMEMARQNAAQYCRGLGNRVDVATGAILIEADRKLRARMEHDIQTETEANIATRKTVSDLKSDLGWATQDWARDLKRIAVTEKVTAMSQGTADHFRKRYGAETLVAKHTMPDACQHCQRLYNGPNGPRVFKLSTLEAHGTNVGRRANDWMAVVGSTHPNCQCVLFRVPAGWGWNEDGELVPGGKVDLYETPEELELAMLQEDDLQKAFKLQGHVVYQGISIAIENKEGSVRKWTDVNGGTGETKMRGVSYGYAIGTLGADEDEVDVFVGPDPRAKMVYIVEQQNPGTGQYDEQKCFLGFPNQDAAERAYRLHYDNPENFIITTESMAVEQFKRWLDLTRPKTGEVLKSESVFGSMKHTTRFVVMIPDEPVPRVKPLRTPVRLSHLTKGLPSEIGAQPSRAGNRAPGPGLGVNYLISVPDRGRTERGYFPGREEILREKESKEEEGALHVDKEVYDFMEPLLIARPWEYPEAASEAHEEAREGTEERGEYVKREPVKNAGRPKNKVERNPVRRKK